jgi:hypothetical protein
MKHLISRKLISINIEFQFVIDSRNKHIMFWHFHCIRSVDMYVMNFDVILIVTLWTVHRTEFSAVKIFKT